MSDSTVSSRRSVLAAAVGAGAAAIGGSLARPGAAHAVGDPVLLGTTNAASSATTVTNNAGGPALIGYTTDPSRYGVLGSTQAGIYAQADAVGERAVEAASYSGTGVFGYSSQFGTGVFGTSAHGLGVHAATGDGVALYAEASAGTALQAYGTGTAIGLDVVGRIRVQTVSGVKSIRAGRTSVTFSPGVDVRASSFVLLTPRVNLGGRSLWYTVDASANKVTIRISSSRRSSTPVAWLLLG